MVSAVRNWHMTSCRTFTSWKFSSPSTLNPPSAITKPTPCNDLKIHSGVSEASKCVRENQTPFFGYQWVPAFNMFNLTTSRTTIFFQIGVACKGHALCVHAPLHMCAYACACVGVVCLPYHWLRAQLQPRTRAHSRYGKYFRFHPHHRKEWSWRWAPRSEICSAENRSAPLAWSPSRARILSSATWRLVVHAR